MKSLFLSNVDNLKELVIEEGVKDAELMCLNFAEGATVSFPSSLKVLDMAAVAIVQIPKSVNRLCLAIYSDDPIVVPDRCKVEYITGRYPRLVLGADVDCKS